MGAIWGLLCWGGCNEKDQVKTDPAVEELVQAAAVEEAEPVQEIQAEKKPESQPAYPKVKMTTSMGVIVLELYPDKAPLTVENFLKYVDDGFYNGTIFHRVIRRFMIQGGGFTAQMAQKPTRNPIVNECGPQLRNLRGTIAMARTSQPNSATSQFFINQVDNPFLDFDGPNKPGYAVFGRVIEGMDVVDRIATVPTTRLPNGMADVPVEPVLIERVERVR
jgi:cyclophilin family peptidyl-prolyl cis-trans isomerase